MNTRVKRMLYSGLPWGLCFFLPLKSSRGFSTTTMISFFLISRKASVYVPCQMALDPTTHDRMVITKRKLRRFYDTAFAPEALQGGVLAIGSVWLLGVLEAGLLTRARSKGRGRFCLRYGLTQILPSIIWLTKPADLLARKMRLEVPKLLRGGGGSTFEGAARENRVYFLSTMRSVIAGFLGIAQILRLVDVASQSETDYNASVLSGKEPWLDTSHREKVIRLGGTTSDVTEFSILKNPRKFIPIFETTNFTSTGLKRLLSSNGQLPFFWHVPSGSYSDSHEWEGFNVSLDWLVPAGDNRKVLIVEADSSIGEEALALGERDEAVGLDANDLDLNEVGQAWVRLKVKLDEAVKRRGAGAWEEGGVAYELARVFLVNGSLPMTTGGGATISHRDYIRLHKEADVIIDAKQPLVKALVQWASGGSPGDKSSRMGTKHPLVFCTQSTNYFNATQKLLGKSGFKVHDRLSAPASPDTLYIVYEKNTADTVHAARQLLRQNISGDRICALLDKFSGVDELKQLERETGSKLHFICSSVLYDEVFTEVRGLIKMGKSYPDIQAFVDTKYHNVIQSCDSVGQ